MFGLWTLNLEIQIQTCDLGTWDSGLRTIDSTWDSDLSIRDAFKKNKMAMARTPCSINYAYKLQGW